MGVISLEFIPGAVLLWKLPVLTSLRLESQLLLASLMIPVSII